MSKRVTALLIIALCLIFAVSASVSAQQVIRFGHPGRAGVHLDVVALEFARLVEEKTNGELKVEVYAQTLGGGRDLVEQVSVGIIEMYADGYTGQEEYDFMFLPYLFRDWEELKNVLLSDVGDTLAEIWVSEKSIRAVGYYGRLPRQLTTARTPVHSVEDVAGLRIRVPEWDVMIRTWSAFDANPTPMAWPEVFSGLQTGVIHAQDNPIDLVLDEGLYEVQNYMVMIDYMHHCYVIGVNDFWYNSLSEEHQNAIEEALRESEVFNEELLAEREQEILGILEEKGMTVLRPDLEGFRERAKVVHEHYLADFESVWGEGVYEKIMSGEYN